MQMRHLMTAAATPARHTSELGERPLPCVMKCGLLLAFCNVRASLQAAGALVPRLRSNQLH